jgi:serine protease inhibitor
MTESWDELEAMLRAMRLEPLSARSRQQVLARLAAAPAPLCARRPHYGRWLAASAAAALVAALGVWLVGRATHGPGPVARPPVKEDHRQTPTAIALSVGWHVEPTGNAVYEVTSPDRISLRHGELLVESRSSAERGAVPPLGIETPAGAVRAAGAKFYIGSHFLPTETRDSKGAVVMTSFTRVLVLAGVVALANAQGNVIGQANQLLAAQTGKAPANYAVTANSDFAIDLYRQLSQGNPDGNLFFSPYSISSALAMAAEGARGQTALEMGQALRFPAAARRIGDDAQLIPWNTSLLHTGMAQLTGRLEKAQKPVPQEITDKVAELRKQIEASYARGNALLKTRPTGWLHQRLDELQKSAKLKDELAEVLSHVDQYEVHVANALWGEKSHPFLPSYVQTIHGFYKTGGLFSVDFKNNPETARQEINAWVEKQTADKIKDLLSLGSVDPNTRLVLTNAIYFLGNWTNKFDAKSTSDQDFSVSSTEKVKAPLMHQLHNYRYWANNSLQVLELPYKGGDLAMLVLLPRQADGLAAVEKSLSAASIGKARAKLQPENVDAYLPKFKLHASFELNGPLTALGMKQAFVAGKADFAGIDGGEGLLYISRVIHRAFVDVNERGTEAAAATVVHHVLGLPAVPAHPVVFRADHPFLFLICDNHSGSVLFLGRMTNPKGQ